MSSSSDIAEHRKYRRVVGLEASRNEPFRPGTIKYATLLKESQSAIYKSMAHDLHVGLNSNEDLDALLWDRNEERFVQACAAICYDNYCRECPCDRKSGPANREEALRELDTVECMLGEANKERYSYERGQMPMVFTSLFEHMLLIDYDLGIAPMYVQSAWVERIRQYRRIMDNLAKAISRAGRCGVFAAPGKQCRQELSKYLKDLIRTPKGSLELSDFAIMVAHYDLYSDLDSDHNGLSWADYERNLTGYRGAMPRLIEAARAGAPEGLARRLVADVHSMIPKCVRDGQRQQKMMERAEDIAAEFDIMLFKPTPVREPKAAPREALQPSTPPADEPARGLQQTGTADKVRDGSRFGRWLRSLGAGNGKNAESKLGGKMSCDSESTLGGGKDRGERKDAEGLYDVEKEPLV